MTERQEHTSCCERYGKAFSAWDLRLYLDTHPDDAQALACFAQMYHDMNGEGYPFRGIEACSFGSGVWKYLDGPWPWEPDANCKVDASACVMGGR